MADEAKKVAAQLVDTWFNQTVFDVDRRSKEQLKEVIAVTLRPLYEEIENLYKVHESDVKQLGEHCDRLQEAQKALEKIYSGDSTITDPELALGRCAFIAGKVLKKLTAAEGRDG